MKTRKKCWRWEQRSEFYLDLGVSETEDHSECYITFYLFGVGDKCTTLHHKEMSWNCIENDLWASLEL